MNDLLFEIDNIDYKATALHVKHFLDTKLPHILRIANESPAYLCSPVMSGMPSSDHSGNSNEDKIVKYLNAKMILNSIAKAFKNCSQASFTILKDKYISSLSDWQIAANMYCSKATYFRMRDRAYNEFADCFEVQQGGTDLHIYLHE